MRAWVLIVLLVLPATASAFEEMNWQGFYTVGGTWVDNNFADGYHNGIGQSLNMAEYTRLGLNLSANLTDDWTFFGQILAKKSNDDASLRADWMYLAYSPSDDLTLRLGKIKANVWFISDYIDVGKTFIWAAPPEEVYDMFPVKSYDGASVSWQKELGDYTLSAEFGSGSFDLSGDFTIRAERFHLGILSFGNESIHTRLALVDMSIENEFLGEVINNSRSQIATGALSVTLGDLRFLGEVATIMADDTPTTDLAAARAGLDAATAEYAAAQAATRAARQAAADAVDDPATSADEKRLAENAVRSAVANEAAAARAAGMAAMDVGIAETRVDGMLTWHMTVAWTLGDYVPYFYVAEIDQADPPAFFGDQRSYALGLVYNINFNLDIKGEVKFIQVLNDTYGMFNKNQATTALLEDKEATKYTITLNAVF